MRQQIERWMAFHAVILLATSFLFLFLEKIHFIALTGAFSFFSLYILYTKREGSLRFLSQPANLLTTLRLILLLLLLWFHASLSVATVVAISLVVLLTDGLDGWLARRFKTESVFGEYLDMETDAFFVLVMTCLLYEQGITGWWILSVGLLRYVYFILIQFLKPPEIREERIFLARLVAVILMSSLIGGFVLPPWIARPILVVAATLLFFSFARSFWVVLKHNL